MPFSPSLLSLGARSALTLALSSVAGLAAAAPAEPPAVGGSTRALLAQQREGSQAAPTLPVLGATSNLAYQRYLESFKTKIPDRMASDISKGGATR